MLLYPPALLSSHPRFGALASSLGPQSPLAQFLRDLGPVLLEKYNPKAIVVFSAHWESEKVGEVLATDYKGEGGNPLLMDFYGFPPEIYKIKFESRGDSNVSQRVVDLLNAAHIPARVTPVTEPRGKDGRGFSGAGLDHGVFVPLLLMFGTPCPIPIIQVSLPSLSPTALWETGRALSNLRSEGVLILSGGLTLHTFEDFDAFDPEKAGEVYRVFEKRILEAVEIEEPEKRKEAMINLVNAEGFRKSHPREEHFVPIYVAAGAAETKEGKPEREGKALVLAGIHGAKTVAFGV